jgi:tellurite methyltransferase
MSIFSSPPTASSDEERKRWNQKYRETRSASEIAPDPFLLSAFLEYILLLFPRGGRALDLAGGAGRHAIWLAKQGWEVTLIDISDAGVEQARQNAGPLATQIHFVVDDLTRYKASQTPFDVVMAFFYLERSIFSEVLRSLSPRGLLIYKSYTLLQATLGHGPKSPAYLLAPGELREMARGLCVLHYSEEVADNATAELVARKQSDRQAKC